VHKLTNYTFTILHLKAHFAMFCSLSHASMIDARLSFPYCVFGYDLPSLQKSDLSKILIASTKV
jgi:hypothetical protein